MRINGDYYALLLDILSQKEKKKLEESTLNEENTRMYTYALSLVKIVEMKLQLFPHPCFLIIIKD